MTLLLTTTIALTLLVFNLRSQSGSNIDEVIFLGTITIIFITLIPLYLKKVYWSWAAGIIIYLGLYLGAIKEAFDGVLYFSLSYHNVGVFLFYLIAIVGIVFSGMSLREHSKRQLKNSDCSNRHNPSNSVIRSLYPTYLLK